MKAATDSPPLFETIRDRATHRSASAFVNSHLSVTE